MIAFTSALMLMLAANPADAMGKARQDYSACLSRFMQDALERKMDTGEYKGALKAKCADQEAAFRTAILASDKADGMNAKDSAADADDQIAEYLDKFTSEYEDYQNNAAPPGA